MIVIKMRGLPNPTPEEAQDSLAGIKEVPGFLFAYIDGKENRVVSFHTDFYPTSPLGKGQQRLELVFKEQAPATAGLGELGKSIADGLRKSA